MLMLQTAAVLVAMFALGPVGAATQSGSIYAIRGAQIHTAAGAPIENGTILMQNGVIVAVGDTVTVPSDAIVIDGDGLDVYPGLIDLSNSAPIDTGDAPAQPQGGRGFGSGGGRGGGGGEQFATREEAERAKRTNILRPDYLAAENLRTSSDDLNELASAGVTTVLAVPDSGIFKGQSALVNVVLPPDDPQISTIADYRSGLAVVRSPVATHIDMAGRGAGEGYPQALLGTIAFTKQGLLDAQWQREARMRYEQAGGRGPRPLVEPALDALAPALAGEMPAALDADEVREIDRALAIAAEFGLDPIIVGASGAAARTEELKAAGARVILSLNFPTGRGGGGGGRGGRGGGAPSLRQLQAQANAPKVPAALAEAGVPFAFSSGGQAPAEFVRNAGRTVSEGGLSAEAALRALTIDAARIAGAEDRTGSIEIGKIANLVVTSGDLFSGGQVSHVFVDGHPVTIEPPAPPQAGRGRGGR
jgi:imidazolonepropionase-like amidohydrolase